MTKKLLPNSPLSHKFQTKLLKKYFVFIVIIILGLFQLSCSTTSPLRSQRKPYEVDTAYVYHLPSFILSIEKGDRQQFNKDFSDSTFNMRSTIFNTYLPQSITPLPLEFKNTNEQVLITNYFFELINSVERQRKIKSISINDTIVDFLHRNKIKYTIISFHSGFTRQQGNYKKQIAKSAGIGLLTLGMVIPIPVKSNSTTICFVIDTENKNIAFYKKESGEIEPLEQKNINHQINTNIVRWITER